MSQYSLLGGFGEESGSFLLALDIVDTISMDLFKRDRSKDMDAFITCSVSCSFQLFWIYISL